MFIARLYKKKKFEQSGVLHNCPAHRCPVPYCPVRKCPVFSSVCSRTRRLGMSHSTVSCSSMSSSAIVSSTTSAILSHSRACMSQTNKIFSTLLNSLLQTYNGNGGKKRRDCRFRHYKTIITTCIVRARHYQREL